MALSKLGYNKIKLPSPTVFGKLSLSCMHNYTCILLIATMYIHLFQIIKYTFLNSNVSDLEIRIFNMTSLSFHYRFILILLYVYLIKYSPSVFREFERHNIRFTLAQHSIFEIESVARTKRRQGLRLGKC